MIRIKEDRDFPVVSHLTLRAYLYERTTQPPVWQLDWRRLQRIFKPVRNLRSSARRLNIIHRLSPDRTSKPPSYEEADINRRSDYPDCHRVPDISCFEAYQRGRGRWKILLSHRPKPDRSSRIFRQRRRTLQSHFVPSTGLSSTARGNLPSLRKRQ